MEKTANVYNFLHISPKFILMFFVLLVFPVYNRDLLGKYFVYKSAILKLSVCGFKMSVSKH